MADEDRIENSEETSEVPNMASEATPPPEPEEARDDLSTPTQDELPQTISSLTTNTLNFSTKQILCIHIAYYQNL